MEIGWDTRFEQHPVVPGIPHQHNVAEQVINSPEYYYEGKNRNGWWYLFQYTLEGEGVFWDAQGEYRLPAGHGFLCRINDPETGYYYPRDAVEDWHILFMTWHGADEQVRHMLERFGPIYRLKRDSALITAQMALEKQAGQRTEVTPGEGMRMVASLLAGLVDAEAELTSDTAAAWLVREVRRLVHARRDLAPNVTDLADTLNITPEHLCRTFKQETGITTHTFISRERIRRAGELLRDPSYSVKEVAGILSFDTTSHFARTFKKVTGMNPTEFRRKGGSAIF